MNSPSDNVDSFRLNISTVKILNFKHQNLIRDSFLHTFDIQVKFAFFDGVRKLPFILSDFVCAIFFLFLLFSVCVMISELSNVRCCPLIQICTSQRGRIN